MDNNKPHSSRAIMWITVAVFVAGTILGAIVKSIFEMTIRSWLERRAKSA